MRYIVKFLALIGLVLGVVYTFYINGNVSSYGFWSWTLSVVVSLLSLCNVASLIAAFNYSSYNKDQIEDEKCMFVLSSFIGFFIYCGIFFFSINNNTPDWLFLGCSFLAYLFSCGLNRTTWAFIFLGFTHYIFFCENFFAMNSWSIWAIYVFVIIIHVISIIYIMIDRLSSDSEPPIEKFGLLIPVIVFIYIWFTNNIALNTEKNALLILCYLLLFILSSIRDSVNMFVGISVISVIYLLIYPSNFELYLLVLIGISCVFVGILHTLYLSCLLTKLEEATGYNKNLIKKYNILVDDYNRLKNSSSKSNNSSGRGKEISGSNSGEKILGGVLSELGRTAVRIGIEMLS